MKKEKLLERLREFISKLMFTSKLMGLEEGETTLGHFFKGFYAGMDTLESMKVFESYDFEHIGDEETAFFIALLLNYNESTIKDFWHVETEKMKILEDSEELTKRYQELKKMSKKLEPEIKKIAKEYLFFEKH